MGNLYGKASFEAIRRLQAPSDVGLVGREVCVVILVVDALLQCACRVQSEVQE